MPAAADELDIAFRNAPHFLLPEDVSPRTRLFLQMVNCSDWPVPGWWLPDGSVFLQGTLIENGVGRFYLPPELQSALETAYSRGTMHLVIGASDSFLPASSHSNTSQNPLARSSAASMKAQLQRFSRRWLEQNYAGDLDWMWLEAAITKMNDLCIRLKGGLIAVSGEELLGLIDVVQSLTGPAPSVVPSTAAWSTIRHLRALIDELDICSSDASPTEKRVREALAQLRYAINRLEEATSKLEAAQPGR